MEDITSKLRDINDTDRVFKCKGPVYVKVRVVRQTAPPGSPEFGTAVVTLSGSQTDARGRALSLGDGYRIIPAENRVVMSDETVDVQTWLDGLRQECVEKVLLAARQQSQIDEVLAPRP